MSTTIASDDCAGPQLPARQGFLAEPWRELRRLCVSGLNPRAAALAVSLGIALGLLPIPWGTSLLCLLIGWFLRLNQPLIQLLNYLCYPLQIALYLPFCKLGCRWFAPDHFALNLPADWRSLVENAGQLAGGLWQANLFGVAAWGCCLPLLLALSYPTTRLALSLLPCRRSSPETAKKFAAEGN